MSAAAKARRATERRPVWNVAADERGVSLLWFALFLLLSLGFIALGIDIAKLAATRTQLQNAADGAALAAASAVNPATGHLDHDNAVARAIETGSLNKAFILKPEPVTVASDDVVFPDANTVQVTVGRSGAESIVAQVAQVLGIPALQVHATAVARAETSSSVQCILPIGITLEAGENFTPDCNVPYPLKLGPGNGYRGNYGYLSLPKCADGPCQQPGNNPNQIACLIAKGFCCGMSVGDNVTTAPGTKTPAMDGIDDRFAADTDRRENICNGDYHGNGSRIVTLPVLNFVPNGAGNATVRGFASFFLRNKVDPSTGALTGEFIYVSSAGTGGGKPVQGAVSYSAHLVR